MVSAPIASNRPELSCVTDYQISWTVHTRGSDNSCLYMRWKTLVSLMDCNLTLKIIIRLISRWHFWTTKCNNSWVITQWSVRGKMLIAGVQILHLDICLSPCIFVSVIKNECAVTLYVLRNESWVWHWYQQCSVRSATWHDEISWVSI